MFQFMVYIDYNNRVHAKQLEMRVCTKKEEAFLTFLKMHIIYVVDLSNIYREANTVE